MFREDFLDEHILAIFKKLWYADIVNYLVTRQLPTEWTKQDQYRFFAHVQYFFWEEPYLFKYCPDQIFDDIYQKKNGGACLVSAINLHVEDTLVPAKSHRKFYKVSFTGPLYLKTHSIFVSHVRIVERLGKFRDET